jgi:hypothetical protein
MNLPRFTKLQLALAFGLATLVALPAQAQNSSRQDLLTLASTCEIRILYVNADVTRTYYNVLIEKPAIAVPASAPAEDLTPSLISFMGQDYHLATDYIFYETPEGMDQIVPFYNATTVQVTDVARQENGWYNIYLQASTGEEGYFVVVELHEMYSFLEPIAPAVSMTSQLNFISI